jgi:hypothetical protein
VSNTATLALSHANLETAILQMQALGDDRGEEISIMPDLLIVPRALRQTALELTKSPLTPESAENAINVHDGELQVMVWEYLTDSNAWFLVDTTMAKRNNKWFWRLRPNFRGYDEPAHHQRMFQGTMRYSRVFTDFRWILGSNPS